MLTRYSAERKITKVPLLILFKAEFLSAFDTRVRPPKSVEANKNFELKIENTDYLISLV